MSRSPVSEYEPIPVVIAHKVHTHALSSQSLRGPAAALPHTHTENSTIGNLPAVSNEQ